MYQIRYFLAVCETLNFTRAAEKCYVSQPSLTKAIQKLEASLGGRLFDRTRNSVQMTELGRLMQPHLRDLYTSAREARQKAKEFLSGQVQRLHLGLMCTICFEPVTPMLASFRHSNTALEVHVEEGTLEKLTDLLDRGEIDAALMASPYEFPKRFDAMPLYQEEIVVACPPGHPLAGRGIALSDIRGEPYVSRDNCEYQFYLDDLLNERGIAVPVVQTAGREDWIQSMVRAGMGIAFMPENTCQAARLPFCRVADPHIARDVQVLTLTSGTQEKPPAVQAFLRHAGAYDWRAANGALSRAAAA